MFNYDEEIKGLIENKINNTFFTSIHNHTDYSNIRLLDSTNTYKTLINRALELNYNGVAITDHEHMGALPYAYWYLEDLKDKEPDNKKLQNFKFIFGNEVYLVNDLEQTKINYKEYKNGFYHLILLAKDTIGYEQLKELSTSAWSNEYVSKRQTRVPLEKTKLKEIIESNKGHIICSSACLGSYLDKILLQRYFYQQQIEKIKKYLEKIDFLTQTTIEKYKEEYIDYVDKYNSTAEDLKEYFDFYLGLFGDDYYLELQPSNSPDQIYINKELIKLGKELNIKWIITTDSHYLSLEQQSIHSAYLNSGDGDREVASFYATTYMMEREEIFNYLYNNELEIEDIVKAFENTKEIYDKCQNNYKLEKGFQIPKINDLSDKIKLLKERTDIQELINKTEPEYKSIFAFLNAESEQEQYYIYSSLSGVISRNFEYSEKVKHRINLECEELIEISKNLKASLSQYYISVQKIIEIMWTEGDSLVGPGRGSVGCWFTAYLMYITDTCALDWDLPAWRHIDRSKIELSDIDIDSQANRRSKILQAVKNYFGEDKVLTLCTYGTEGSKSAVITACRALGYDSDIGIYISSLIPIDRGKPRSLDELINGNEEKGYEKSTDFINQINKYPNLLETAQGISGLINKRGIHASAIVIYNDSYIKHTPMMKAPNGLSVTQYDAPAIERLGGVKIDLLTIKSLDKIRYCLDLLIEDKVIEPEPTLKETYNKYLAPNVLDYETKEMWELVDTGEIAGLFQYNTELAISISKKLKPRSLVELANGNSLMRLMSEDGKINPVDKYISFKNNSELWEQEMDKYNLTQKEREIIRKYFSYCFGVPSQQEDLQRIVMDRETWNYDVGQSTHCRKVISKFLELL